MANEPVRVEIPGLADGMARMERAKRVLGNPRPLLEIAGGLLEASTIERFRTGRGPGGVPWPISRRAAAQGGRTMIDKGLLLASITHETREHEVEVGVVAKSRSGKFSHVLHFGATIRPRKARFLVFTGPDGHKVFARSVTIPPRPFLGVDDDDRRDLLEAWDEYLEAIENGNSPN